MTNLRDYDVTFKVLVLGDSGVGKTSLIRRFTDGDFSFNFLPTIGIDSKVKIIPLQESKVRLQIWDTAGQERFRTLTSAYFRGAMGIVLVYDITNAASFTNISGWLDNIHQNVEDDICKIIVGNKSDASIDEREIVEAMGKERAAEGNLPFFETSAKTGDGVTEAFTCMADLIMKHRKTKDSPLARKDLSPFPSSTHEEQRGSTCC